MSQGGSLWAFILRERLSVQLLATCLFCLRGYPRQGQLTKLLQEYGRLVKTIFVLRYLEDAALRQRIRAQLNKGEKLHDLRKFLFFAREGVVSQQYEEGQTNQAGCLNLLTNAVIVWNTVYMQAALNALWAKGDPVREKDLVYLGLAAASKPKSTVRALRP